MDKHRLQQKTYSHLLANKRIPSEYEIVTSKLHYYTERGFEVKTPIAEWYEKYQKQSAFQCRDWDLFSDPRQTTYTHYTAIQKEKESFVAGIFQSIEEKNYDHYLTEDWRHELSLHLSTLRFPYHALQMVAAYLGSMAPSGRLTIAFMLQAADEMRCVHHFAYRLAQLSPKTETIDQLGRQNWENNPAWQPLRRCLERLLITYDWSEAFVALNLGLKPAMDQLFLRDFGRYAITHNDYLLDQVLGSLIEDTDWHQEWTHALVKVLHEDEKNVATLQQLQSIWQPQVDEALLPLAKRWQSPSLSSPLPRTEP